MGGDTFTTFGGMQIIESQFVPEGEVYIIGGRNLAAPKTYAKLKNLGDTENGYLRHQALKELKAEKQRDELEAVPGFGSF